MRALAAAALVLAVACAAPPRSREHYNIVLLVIDTLRADRVDAFGGGRELTPFLDRLAARGFTFKNAYAPSSHTLPSVVSLMTSRYPTQHGVTHFGANLGGAELTLVKVLKQSGYVGAGFVSNGMLGGRERGIQQGFNKFWWSFTGTDAEKEVPPRATEINAKGLDWLDHWKALPTPPPFFLYLHYMEPHAPYDPPARYLWQTAGSSRSPDLGAVDETMTFRTAARTPDLREDVESVYDAEVMAVDEGVAALFAGLADRGLLDGTIVVITNDHGESLGERGRFGHGWSLYQDLIRAPLIVLLPEPGGHATIDATVSLVDVAPTLLDLIGVARPPRFEGRSFADLLTTEPWWTLGLFSARRAGDDRSAFSEVYLDEQRTKRLRAFVRGSQKLIVGPDGRTELYDLADDPLEQTPISSAPMRRQLEEELLRVTEHLGAPPGATAPPPIDAAIRERLRMLGYVDGAPPR